MNTPGASPLSEDTVQQLGVHYEKFLGDLASLLGIGSSGAPEDRLREIRDEQLASSKDLLRASTEVSVVVAGRPDPEPPGAERPPEPFRAASPAESGLSGFAAEWPPERIDALREVERDVAAVLRLWGSPQDHGGEPGRFLRSLADRREIALLFASSAVYAAARASGLSADVVDACAERFAQFLGERLFGSPTRVFAVRRGPIRDAEHELVGGHAAFGLVRCVAFGIRGPRGEVACKALVEPDERGEDA